MTSMFYGALSFNKSLDKWMNTLNKNVKIC